MHLAPPPSSLLKAPHVFPSFSTLTSLDLSLLSFVSLPPNSYIAYSFPNTNHPQTLYSSRNPILLYVSILSVSSPPYDPKLPSHSLIIAPQTSPATCLPQTLSPQASFASLHTSHGPKSPHVAPSFQSNPIIPISATYPQPPTSPLPQTLPPHFPSLPYICSENPQPLLPSPLRRQARGLPTFRLGEPFPARRPPGLGLGQLAQRRPLSGSPSPPPPPPPQLASRSLPRVSLLAPLSRFLRAPSFSLFLSSPIPLSQAPSLRRPLSCASRRTRRPASPQPRVGPGPRAGTRFRGTAGLGEGLGGDAGDDDPGRAGAAGGGRLGGRGRASAGCAGRARAAAGRAARRAGRAAGASGAAGAAAARPRRSGRPGEAAGLGRGRARAAVGICSGGRANDRGQVGGNRGMGAALRGGRTRRRRRRGGD